MFLRSYYQNVCCLFLPSLILFVDIKTSMSELEQITVTLLIMPIKEKCNHFSRDTHTKYLTSKTCFDIYCPFFWTPCMYASSASKYNNWITVQTGPIIRSINSDNGYNWSQIEMIPATHEKVGRVHVKFINV